MSDIGYGGDNEGYYDQDGLYFYDSKDGGSGGTGGGGGGGGWDWWGDNSGGNGGGNGGGYAVTGYNPDGSPIYNIGATYGTTVTGNGGGGGGGGGPWGGMNFSNPFTSTKSGTPTTGTDLTLSPWTTGKGSSNPPTQSNTQNNTQNNTNSLSQSVGLGAVSPISSGVPGPQNFRYTPIDIANSGGMKEGQPPMMPTAKTPPTLHPEKPPTDWSKVTFGAADSAPSQEQQGNPASGQQQSSQPTSKLGAIGKALGGLTGVTKTINNYKGVYDQFRPKKRSRDQINRDAYGSLYGGDATYEG